MESKRVTPNKLRKKRPRLTQGKGGTVISCPFCRPTHPISMDPSERCGTYLEVTAVQPVTRGKSITCVLCREGGGTLVKHHDGYVHAHNCSPDKILLDHIPETNRLAAFVYNFPHGRIRRSFVKRYGNPAELKEVDKTGAPTGNILGYHFIKDRNDR